MLVYTGSKIFKATTKSCGSRWLTRNWHAGRCKGLPLATGEARQLVVFEICGGHDVVDICAAITDVFTVLVGDSAGPAPLHVSGWGWWGAIAVG